MNIIIFQIFKRKEKKILRHILDGVEFIDNNVRMAMVYTSKIAEKIKLSGKEIDSVLEELRKENIVRNMSVVGGDKSWCLTQYGLELMHPDSYQLFKEGLKLSGVIIGIIAGLIVLATILAP